MGKIALELDRALAERAGSGAPGRTAPRPLGRGSGWSADDMICTYGPADTPFDEAHERVSVTIVVAGTFEYRTATGRHHLTPGALMLGQPGQAYQCRHSHAPGDRCVTFQLEPEWCEQVAADAGAGTAAPVTKASRIPPLKELAPIVVRASLGLAARNGVAWEEMALGITALAARLSAGHTALRRDPSSRAVARITESVRWIERDAAAPWTIERLAREAGLSPFHYLRTFQQVTGVTPHQFVLRARLRAAAMHLRAGGDRVMDVALAAGFDDLSTFNHAFRAEFGVTPRAYRDTVAAR